jgi:hypothetical protein
VALVVWHCHGATIFDFESGKEQTMTQANARRRGVSVAALMAASVLISMPATSVLAQTAPCPANPSNVVTPASYSITAVACGLNFPTAMTFQANTIWVTEEGVAAAPPGVDSGLSVDRYRVRSWLALLGTPPNEL